jgi:chromate reductase, NAD(P)H dehydrogenase (quinone)
MTTEGNANIRVVLIGGSVRPGNYTSMALRLVADELGKRGIACEVVDPAKLELAGPGVAPDAPDAKALREKVSRATGVVLATPEYHGSFSSVIKLVIENLGFPSVLAGKPVALLGVAAGVIGAIKSLEGLASICTHVGALVLPGAVSVAGVQKAFDAEGRCLDAGAEKRVRSVATNLVEYIHGNICPRMALEAMVRGGGQTEG